jgi:GAF domain-containing protein
MLDPRLSAQPLVVNAPFVRFYAAARLAVGGHTLGTRCAYDVRPRQVSNQQVEHMQALAAAVVELLNQRPVAEPLQVS